VADGEAGVQDHGLLHSLVFGPVATCVEVRAPAAGAGELILGVARVLDI
jgi:hypothetical protein